MYNDTKHVKPDTTIALQSLSFAAIKLLNNIICRFLRNADSSSELNPRSSKQTKIIEICICKKKSPYEYCTVYNDTKHVKPDTTIALLSLSFAV